MSEPKYKPGDRVAFLWGPMETHHGIVDKYHGELEQGKNPVYSVLDTTAPHMCLWECSRRFLYESEMTLDA